jgi:hypothetical protein
MPINHYLICYNLNEALEKEIYSHPDCVMHQLGIIFKYSSYNATLNQWVFHECTNTPKKKPSYLSMFKIREA